jgi:NAD(P)-dependent dehydrogenase (short-subunit alcohol dehydrogenase family)
MRGQNVLITGANTGIGLATARALAARGYRVFIACRNEPGARALAARIQRENGVTLEVLPLDLARFDSVRSCAEQFSALSLPLHVLINNAGVAGKRARTPSGFELAFGVNHLGHFLLTQLLLPQLRAAGSARVVTVASKAHYEARGIDWVAVTKKTRTITGLAEYSVSKLANVSFSAELARRLAGTGITTYALHPGVVASDAWRHMPQPARWFYTRGMLTPEQGALTSLYCATAPELATETGLYYDDQRQKMPSQAAQDAALAAELWDRSLAWTGA